MDSRSRGAGGSALVRTCGTAKNKATAIVAVARRMWEAALTLLKRDEAFRYVADISKAHDLLSYEPQVPLSAGLVRAVQWCQPATGAS